MVTIAKGVIYRDFISVLVPLGHSLFLGVISATGITSCASEGGTPHSLTRNGMQETCV